MKPHALKHIGKYYPKLKEYLKPLVHETQVAVLKAIANSDPINQNYGMFETAERMEELIDTCRLVLRQINVQEVSRVRGFTDLPEDHVLFRGPEDDSLDDEIFGER